MRPERAFVPLCACTLAVIGASSAQAREPSTFPIRPSAPWARAVVDELSDPWEAGGLGQPSGDPPPPLPALAYEATPGILYLAMDGVTVRPPPCGGGDEAHSAKNCTPLVSQETSFPAYGSGADRANMAQTLRSYYEPFNLTVTTTRPPEWVPYTMAVIGGSAAQAGHGGGTCGIANVKCDGLRRNHVSLTFPQSCGQVAAIAAQETAHNWGLEHVDIVADIMYPFNTGGIKSFRDECMTIDHSTSQTPTTQCKDVHAHYCPAGEGEEQNSYRELLGVFGPRMPDDSPPQIVEIRPSEGTFTSADTVGITARVSENSNFLAAKWTWEQGLPDGMESFTRCSNRVCDQNFSTGVDFDPNSVDWNFITLEQPPPGTYSFRFEVADAHGGYDARVLTLEILPAPDGDSDGTGDDTGGGETEEPSASGAGSTTGPPDVETGGDTDTDTAGIDEDPEGCACRASAPPAPWQATLWLFVSLVALRRDRLAPRGVTGHGA